MKSVKHYLKNPARVRKALTALLGCIVLGVGAHLLPGAVGEWLNILQPVLVTYGVWQVPNEPAPAEPAAPAAPPAA